MPSDYRAYADAAMPVLAAAYNPATGLWHGIGWWNAANALEVVVDYCAATGTDTYRSLIACTFERNRGAALRKAGMLWYRGNFLNTFYDDEGWWALAWLKAFDLTGAPPYLAMAQAIFADLTRGWDGSTCGGGMRWRKDTLLTKNTITSALFLTCAARLSRRTGRADYLAWARAAWSWLSADRARGGLINRDHLFNDGLTPDCANDGSTTWTYNQGVVLGGLVELYRATGSTAYLDAAEPIADAAIRLLVDGAGILVEPSEDWAANRCGASADCPQFKGIFVRNLAVLCAVRPKPAYQAFLIRQADAIWERNQAPGPRFGSRWAGPVDGSDPMRQTAALDALLAAIPFGSGPPGAPDPSTVPSCG